MASTPTSPPQTPNVAFLHRLDIIHDTAHEHNKITPTIRTNAAHISDNSSVVKVIAPMAINTKQNIVGASPIFQLTHHNKDWGVGETIVNTVRAINAHFVHGRDFAAGGGGKLSRGKD